LHQVAPASAEQKRSFLIKKGLTAEEIDEAFRRAPNAPAAVAAAPAPAAPLATGASPFAAPSQPGQQQVLLASS
jgi:peroxin-14